MRLLHTSDWHIGRSLDPVSLHEHQSDFLIWLRDVARDQSVDAILVSGDVYDRSIPSLEAVGLLEQGLISLVEVCPVVMISGNHDSATRLGFGGVLLSSAGLHLRSTVEAIDRPVEIVGADGATALVYGIPYLDPDKTRQALEAERSHVGVIGAAMDRVRTDLAARRESANLDGRTGPSAVVLAHAFIHGGTVSTSERDITVGGIADAPASVFNGVDYVALGHLHGPQEISNPGGPVVRYSGTPLAYSFSEENHAKSVTLVEIAGDGSVSVELIPTPVPRRLKTIRGDLDSLLSDSSLTDFEDCWVRAIVTDPRRPESAIDHVRSRFPHTIALEWSPHLDGQPLQNIDRLIDPATSDPVSVVLSFVEHVTSVPASENEAALIRESIERVQARVAAE